MLTMRGPGSILNNIKFLGQFIVLQAVRRLRRISRVTDPKEVSLRNSAQQQVRVNKPAHPGNRAITYKTGGSNRDAECSGKNVGLQARKGNLSRWKVTGGADFTAKPIQLSGMRKGSVFVRGVAPKGSYAV